MKKMAVLVITFLLLSACNLYADEYFYTYEENVLVGEATVHSAIPGKGCLFDVMFSVTSKTNSSINLKKVAYRAVYKNGSIYKLENPIMLYNEGIAGSYVLNPDHEAYFMCAAPFKDYSEVNSIKEIYIKIGSKRIFFVREADKEEYSKPENKALRHLRNLWWNVK